MDAKKSLKLKFQIIFVFFCNLIIGLESAWPIRQNSGDQRRENKHSIKKDNKKKCLKALRFVTSLGKMFSGINLPSLDLRLSFFFIVGRFFRIKKAQPGGRNGVGVRKSQMRDLLTFVLGKDAQYEKLIFVFYDGEVIIERALRKR